MQTKSAKPNTIRRTITRFHHGLGVAITLFVLIISITGIMINHAHQWSLDSQTIPHSVAEVFYNQKQQSMPESWDITCHAGVLFFEQSDLKIKCQNILFYTRLNQMLIAVDQNKLLIWFQGELLEQLTPEQLGLEGISKLGIFDKRLVLSDAQNTIISDADVFEWSNAQSQQINQTQWIEERTVDEPIYWERFLLDLHAGRFLGFASSTTLDLIAAGLIYMSLSGVWLWFKRRKKAKNRLN
ncbi:MAG: PepSY domain-containing protein [bacterium]